MPFLARRKSSTILPCDPSLVYEILTDYDNYFEWLPFVIHSKLLAREGDLAIAEFELLSHRHAKVAVECIHTRNKAVLMRKISGDVPLHEWHWSITPSTDGKTEVLLNITRERNWKELFRKTAPVEKYLEPLKSRVAMFSSDFRTGEKSGQKVLEVFETDEGLDLWVLGKKYVLRPAPEEHHD